MNISNDERLNLKKMLDKSDCQNNSEQIRKLKHSLLIRDDILRMIHLKSINDFSDPEKFLNSCKAECSFLFNYYTDLFNKLLKDELDMKIMTQLLTVLKMIEDGQVDQHEGSAIVGKILKELYVDSALRRAENLDNEHAQESVEPNEGIKISWKEFKML